MGEWVALRDEAGHVCARYNPRYRILVIKRRGEESRFHLALYDELVDNHEQACYHDENSAAAQRAPSASE